MSCAFLEATMDIEAQILCRNLHWERGSNHAWMFYNSSYNSLDYVSETNSLHSYHSYCGYALSPELIRYDCTSFPKTAIMLGRSPFQPFFRLPEMSHSL